MIEKIEKKDVGLIKQAHCSYHMTFIWWEIKGKIIYEFHFIKKILLRYWFNKIINNRLKISYSPVL